MMKKWISVALFLVACSSDDKHTPADPTPCTSAVDCPESLPYCNFDEGMGMCGAEDLSPKACAPLAVDGECECGSPAVGAIVTGEGESCDLEQRDVVACFEQSNTCLNSCVEEFFRYDLGDGTAVIALGLQGSISPGWVSDGQSDRALSCPVVGYWTPNPDDTRTAQQFVYPSEVDSEGPSYYQLSANLSEPLRCVEIGQPGSLFFVPPAFLTASAGSVFTLEDGIVYPRVFSNDNNAFDIRAVEGSVTVLTNEDGRITGEYTFETWDFEVGSEPEEGQTETVSGIFDAIVCD